MPGAIDDADALHTGVGKLEPEKQDLIQQRSAVLVPDEATLPHGAIVGAICISHSVKRSDCDGNPWATGPVCNAISAVASLPRPVAAKGQLGLWPVGTDELVLVRAQLDDAVVSHIDPSRLPPQVASVLSSPALGGRKRARGESECALPSSEL